MFISRLVVLKRWCDETLLRVKVRSSHIHQRHNLSSTVAISDQHNFLFLLPLIHLRPFIEEVLASGSCALANLPSSSNLVSRSLYEFPRILISAVNPASNSSIFLACHRPVFRPSQNPQQPNGDDEHASKQKRSISLVQVSDPGSNRKSGPTDFEPLNDRRMEWSPIHPSAQGSSSTWVPQWVCRSCGSSTSMEDIPTLPAVSCSQCSTSAVLVFDRPSGRVARFCLSCQHMVPHNGGSPPLHTPTPPEPAPLVGVQSPTPLVPAASDSPVTWFSHGPLARFGTLYGWGT